MSNLKQIGLGIMQYTQDYDEHYPLAWLGAPGSGFPYPGEMRKAPYSSALPGHSGDSHSRVLWMDLIYPYTKSVQICNCPSAKLPAEASYGYNVAISNNHSTSASHGGGLPNRFPISTAAVQRAAEVVMIGDANSRWHLNYGAENYNHLTRPNGPVAEYARVSPHFEGSAMTFADGHAKWRKTSEVRGKLNAGGSCTTVTGSTANGLYCSRDWNPFLP